jgi:exodeoxyribonuclease VII large subunit
MKQGDLFGEPSATATPSTRQRAVESQPKPDEPVRSEVAERPAAPLEPVETPRAVDRPVWRRPAREARRVLSVSELTAQLKNSLEPAFSSVIVRGEVTGFRGANTRGHLYFALKDQNAQIDVRVWQTMARTLRFQVRDGLSVLVEGGLNVYEPQGRYSLIAQRIEPEGVGALALAFEQLKERLTKEGLLGPNRTKPKRPLPRLPRRVGVVTSAAGAAWRDFVKVLHRRHPRLSVLLCDAKVQGEGADIEVARALRWMSRTDVDVVVVTRGGGSVEDLWTFNEERVVRAIFACSVPVVSAVGHEVDVTLADLVADHRASTPSAAAELVAPVLADLELTLATTRRRLRHSVEKRVLSARHRLQALRGRLGDPRRPLTNRRLALSERSERLRKGVDQIVRREWHRVESLNVRLTRMRPQAKVAQRREAFLMLARRMRAALVRRIAERRARLHRFRVFLERHSPRLLAKSEQRRLEDLSRRLPLALRRSLTTRKAALSTLAARLDALSPLKVLSRGYALVTTLDGQRVVLRADEVQPQDQILIRFEVGDCLIARVEGRRAPTEPGGAGAVSPETSSETSSEGGVP